MKEIAVIVRLKSEECLAARGFVRPGTTTESAREAIWRDMAAWEPYSVVVNEVNRSAGRFFAWRSAASSAARRADSD